MSEPIKFLLDGQEVVIQHLLQIPQFKADPFDPAVMSLCPVTALTVHMAMAQEHLR